MSEISTNTQKYNSKGSNKRNERREQREQAFILIFEHIFLNETIDMILENSQSEIEKSSYSYILATLVYQNQKEIDEQIVQYSTKWKINRISKVSLAILRLAICEITKIDKIQVPISVTINEAVEIAKKYATPDDASYINGVLGALVKDIPA
ncbi:MAG: transcription antitermination factor NusB [Oscillospiraceae bacterium]